MWILVLLLSIKLQMPTWYWVIFTTITIIRLFVRLIEHELIKELMKDK